MLDVTDNPNAGGDGASLTIDLIDGFALRNQRNDTLQITNRKACGILSYLALNRNNKETRERLVGLLWSDRPEKQARASLRQCLKQLRTAFDQAGIHDLQTGHLEISLNAMAVTTDLGRIADDLSNNIVNKTLLEVANAPDRILYGFETLDQSFSAWLHVIRQNWSNSIVGELQRILRDEVVPDKANQLAADAILRIDPTHEEAHRQCMRTYADNGNTAAALKQYNELWDLLDRDYDMEPENPTQALVAEIKNGSYVSASEQASAPVPNITVSPTASVSAGETSHPVIRVLPFSSGGIGQADTAALVVEGFRQDLMASMARFRDWIVLDQSQLNGTTDNHGANSSARDGGYGITGTYFQGGDELHLLVTLKNVSTNQMIWSERLRLSHENWFNAQRECVMRISASTSIYLTARHVTQTITSPDIPQDAYRPWLSAYRMIWSWDPENRARAEVIFKDIIERFPDFSPAYSGLASIYNTEQIIYPGKTPNPDRLQSATQLSRTAVALDPLDVRSHIALAWSNSMTLNFEQAVNHHRLVYELNPNNPTTLISCAGGLAICGDTEAASEIADQALKLLPSINPVQWAYLTTTRFACGDYKACLEAADLSCDILPMVPGFRAAAVGLSADQPTAEAAGDRFVDYISEKWQGPLPSNRQNVTNWFFQHCPIKNDEIRDKMEEGLNRAGLPSPASH